MSISFDHTFHFVKSRLRSVLVVTGLLRVFAPWKPRLSPLRSVLCTVWELVGAMGGRKVLQTSTAALGGFRAILAFPRRVMRVPGVGGELLWPRAFRIYFHNWCSQTFGRYGLETRRRMAALPPSDRPPRGSALRVFQGLYATVQPVFLKESFTKAGMEARYETLDHNPAFTKPDTVHSDYSHPDLYIEHVRFERGNLMRRRPVFVDDYTLNRLFEFFSAQRARYDVFHFNWFLSFLPDNMDVQRLRQDGKAVYFHFRGCFILSTLLTDQFTKQGGNIADACHLCKKSGWRDQYFDRFHRAVSFSDRVFVSTPNLCHCSSSFEYVPLSLDPALALLPEPAVRPLGGPVRVLHCVSGPGHYAVKGTDHIRNAVEKLQGEGLAVELEIIEQMSREDAVQRFANGDLLVEQLNLGAYGNVAIEAMAHGLPVISSLDATVAHLIPGCPIVNASPTTIVDRLRELVVDAEKRQDLGRRCYRFVRIFHDNDRIANHLAGVYRVDLGLERAQARARNTIENRNPSYE